MYALVAFKRVLTRADSPDRHQLGFEIRNFGCFNGFNQPSAFRYNSTQEGIDFIAEVQVNGQPVVDNLSRCAVGYPRGANATHRSPDGDYHLGDWECLGIGYLASKIGGLSQGAALSALNPANTSGANINNAIIGNMLRREGFMSSYYDGWNGNMQQTIRQLTPNEDFLSRFAVEFERGQLTYPEALVNSSRMCKAILGQRILNGGAYQMVGSERSSGIAIAYLQAWRNTCEMHNNGWAARYADFNFLTTVLTQHLAANKSVIAILSYFINAGSDNDNISYAGAHYRAYCTRVGFWETGEFYRDQRSMLVEGRYNKGGQSEAIGANLRVRLQRDPNWREAWGSNDSQFGQLEVIKGGFTGIAGLSRLINPVTINQYRGQAEGLVSQFRDAVERYLLSNPTAQFTEFLARARRLPDLTVAVPRVPVTRADGAAQGFMQWVTQTAEAATTVH